MDKMPDFRPKETVEKMKRETQNNWRLLANELEAVNHNERHLSLLSLINTNKFKLMDIDKERMEEFCFCYPGLMWCTLQLFEEQMVYVLLHHGIFLSHIPMKKEYTVDALIF